MTAQSPQVEALEAARARGNAEGLRVLITPRPGVAWRARLTFLGPAADIERLQVLLSEELARRDIGHRCGGARAVTTEERATIAAAGVAVNEAMA